MRAQLTSEVLKVRSTRTAAALMGSMLALVVAVVLLHGYALPAANAATPSDQLTFLIGWGEVLGALFAGLFGALSFTGEIRYGTIRPTLLVTPRRERVLAAKCLAAAMTGLAFGAVSTIGAAIAGRTALAVRALDSTLTGFDYVQFIVGGAVASALWAMIGLGVGAIVRAQVPTLVGLVTWVLFIESLLVQNAVGLGKFGPSALGQSMSGLHPDTLLTPALGALLLTIYAAIAVVVGSSMTNHRDLA